MPLHISLTTDCFVSATSLSQNISPQIQDRLLIRETLRQLEDHMAQYPQAKRDRIHYNKWRVAQKFPTSEIEEQEDDDLDEEEDRWTFEMSRRYNF